MLLVNNWNYLLTDKKILPEGCVYPLASILWDVCVHPRTSVWWLPPIFLNILNRSCPFQGNIVYIVYERNVNFYFLMIVLFHEQPSSLSSKTWRWWHPSEIAEYRWLSHLLYQVCHWYTNYGNISFPGKIPWSTYRCYQLLRDHLSGNVQSTLHNIKISLLWRQYWLQT